MSLTTDPTLLCVSCVPDPPFSSGVDIIEYSPSKLNATVTEFVVEPLGLSFAPGGLWAEYIVSELLFALLLSSWADFSRK